MLSYSWDKHVDTKLRLDHWLDPNKTGATKLDYHIPFEVPLANFSTEFNTACVNGNLH
ncbi:MAG: hypothetical protein HC896_06450 [Bacteroidales bacterium]|nr:hypothetical protein [Bacteroidales bacterium]